MQLLYVVLADLSLPGHRGDKGELFQVGQRLTDNARNEMDGKWMI